MTAEQALMTAEAARHQADITESWGLFSCPVKGSNAQVEGVPDVDDLEMDFQLVFEDMHSNWMVSCNFDGAGGGRLCFTVPQFVVDIAKAAGMASVHHVVDMVFDLLGGSDDFHHAVGLIGLPLTFGVVNDTPDPVTLQSFDLRKGTAYAFPAERTEIQPGELMQWYLYTYNTDVEATLQFRSSGADKIWSMAIGQYRYGNLFTSCDRMRFKVVMGTDVNKALDGLCTTTGGNAGVRVQGGYIMSVYLSAVEHPDE